MKEAYVKPKLHLESFMLSQSIAVNCGYSDDKYFGKPTMHSRETCGWHEVDGTVIWLNTTNCSGEFSPDYEVQEGCYNAPSGPNTIFSSY